jgi:hypothetical protein
MPCCNAAGLFSDLVGEGSPRKTRKLPSVVASIFSKHFLVSSLAEVSTTITSNRE